MQVPAFAPVSNVLVAPWDSYEPDTRGIVLICISLAVANVPQGYSRTLCSAMPAHLLDSHLPVLHHTACMFTAQMAL